MPLKNEELMYPEPAANTRKTYAALKQPPLRPPPWLFGPVWTVLYGFVQPSRLPSTQSHN